VNVNSISAKRENQQVKTQEEEKIIKTVEVMHNANNVGSFY
jgi:hypothetical protein